MNRRLWLRFLAASIFFAVMLSALYSVLVREVAGDASDEVQRSLYLFIARIVEQEPYAESIRRVDHFRAESPAMPLELWVLGADGAVLASSNGAALPRVLGRLDKPQAIHDLVTVGRFFSGSRAIAIVRLDAAEPTYLVVRNAPQSGRRVFLVLAVFFFATLVGAVFLGLLLVTLYLRGRSREAKRVIAQIEAGDLGARFRADRLDAVGRLMLDFNRMADEIARLVSRLQTAEQSRRELLQELGHDLRTPLTSLRTAIETLEVHGDAMPATERAEFFHVIAGEFDYFRKLIDDLIFIAGIDEPRYRKSVERIDLAALLEIEIRFVQAACATGRAIRFTLHDAAGADVSDVFGDPLLIARLFRNVLENAAKYARSSVQIHVAAQADFLVVTVEDDGPGMTAQAIAGFGRRRAQRVLVDAGEFTASLGLGSVIIRTIVDLHGGHFALESVAAEGEQSGTRLSISLSRARRSPA